MKSPHGPSKMISSSSSTSACDKQLPMAKKPHTQRAKKELSQTTESVKCYPIPLIFHRVSTIFNRFASISKDFLSFAIDFHVISTDFREAQKRGIRRPRKIRMAYNNLEGTWRDFAPKKGQWFVIISNRKSTQNVYFFVKSRSGGVRDPVWPEDLSGNHNIAIAIRR